VLWCVGVCALARVCVCVRVCARESVCVCVCLSMCVCLSECVVYCLCGVCVLARKVELHRKDPSVGFLAQTTASSFTSIPLGWLRLGGSIKLQVSCAKKPYTSDDVLQKRLIICARGGDAPKLPRAIRAGPNEGGAKIWGPNSRNLFDF